MTKGRIISFRATDEDVRIMEEFKKTKEDGVRKLRDSDVLRYALSLLVTGSTMTYTEAVDKFNRYEVIEGIPYINGVPVNGLPVSKLVDNTGIILKSSEKIEESDNSLTADELTKGYQIINGEKCDVQGFPVEEVNGDYVKRGGDVYATDPGRGELKAQAAENAKKVVTEETPIGEMNPAMAEFLKDSEKLGPILEKRDENPSPEEGVDEDYDEDNFIN